MAINRPVIAGGYTGDVMTSPAVVAVLQTGATETSYHRAGAGRSLLLLFVRALADPLGAQLFEHLAARFRVIAPVLPAGVGGGETPGAGRPPVSPSRWLRDLIDGLGLVRPAVVADEWFAGALLGFALMDPHRLGKVIAVRRDEPEQQPEHSGHGMLFVTVDAAGDVAAEAADAVAQLSPFLDD